MPNFKDYSSDAQRHKQVLIDFFQRVREGILKTAIHVVTQYGNCVDWTITEWVISINLSLLLQIYVVMISLLLYKIKDNGQWIS